MLQNFMKNVYIAANRCKEKVCKNQGECTPNLEAWNYLNQFSGKFDDFFVQNRDQCIKNSIDVSETQEGEENDEN